MRLQSSLIALLLTVFLAGMAEPVHARSGLPEFADLVEQAGPAVVNIRTTARASRLAGRMPEFPLPEWLDEDDPFFEFFRRFFPPRGDNEKPERRNAPEQGDGRQIPRGVGSGFIITQDGYVMTNHHVVDGADQIFVTLTDKREFKARLIGSDKRTDVAVVKIEGQKVFPAITIGDPNTLRVGEWVLAIGSPFGLENTVTAGIVSAKGRDTGDYLPFIQTDVAVNPGNSGGPLIDMDGKVVGINSQIYSRTGGFMGISFAIPIDEAMQVADQLRASGRVVRGRIGVGIADVTKEVADPLGLPNDSGALVRSVAADGPAEAGGVQVGDIILTFNGRDIDKASDLPRIVGGTKPGTVVKVDVWRRGERRSVTLTVGEMPADQAAASSQQDAPAEKADAKNALGLGVTRLAAERARELRIRSGVLIEVVEGPAVEAGLREGDVLLAINNNEVDSVPKFNALVAKLPKSKPAVLLVQRGDSAQYVPIVPR
ncbi:MAG: Do family serine endopeptidase [Burkholderiaceae bacterium]